MAFTASYHLTRLSPSSSLLYYSSPPHLSQRNSGAFYFFLKPVPDRHTPNPPRCRAARKATLLLEQIWGYKRTWGFFSFWSHLPSVHLYFPMSTLLPLLALSHLWLGCYNQLYMQLRQQLLRLAALVYQVKFLEKKKNLLKALYLQVSNGL